MICDGHVSLHIFDRFQIYFHFCESLRVLLCSAMPSKNLDEIFVNGNVLDFDQHCIQGKRTSMHEQKLDVAVVEQCWTFSIPTKQANSSLTYKEKGCP